MHTLHSLITKIVDIILPQQCTGCGKSGDLLCVKCLSALPPAPQTEHAFIVAIFNYRNPTIRRVIWQMKYRGVRATAKCFGEMLYEEILGDMGEGLHISKKETFLIVPIPLHKKRERERGYNQSELLAREIMKYDTQNFFELAPHALSRIRETKAQAKSEKRAVRIENLRGVFNADASLVRGKNIILIDDVTTTGATLASARKALRDKGARSVRAYALAH